MVIIAYAEPESPVAAPRNSVCYLPSGIHFLVNKHLHPHVHSVWNRVPRPLSVYTLVSRAPTALSATKNETVSTCAGKVWSGRQGEHCEAAQLTVGSGLPVPGAFWPPAPVDMFICISEELWNLFFLSKTYIFRPNPPMPYLTQFYNFFRSIYYSNINMKSACKKNQESFSTKIPPLWKP